MRLAQDFPQLVFHTPRKHNKCELVFAESLSTETVVGMLLSGADVNSQHYPEA